MRNRDKFDRGFVEEFEGGFNKENLTRRINKENLTRGIYQGEFNKENLTSRI